METSTGGTIDNDLIDFAVGSPDIPTSPLQATILPEISDHLLDSELPVLEQRLQTSKDVPILNSSNETVDVEDILITIDDDVSTRYSDVYTDEHLRRRNSDILLEVCAADETDMCVDDSEVLSVLEELDQVLEDSLEEDIQETNNEEIEDGDVDEAMVRKYLMELDNYLRMLEEVSDAEILNSGRDPNAVRIEDEQEYYLVLPNDNREIFDGTPQSLPVDNANGNVTARSTDWSQQPQLRKTASVHFPRPEARCKGADALQRNHRLRATLSVINSRPTPTVTHANPEDIPPISTPGEQTAAGAHQTETEHHLGAPEMANKESSSSSSWLRSSMRRLRHFRLPSDSIPGQSEDVAEVEVVEVEEVVARPVSAPSRLPTVANGASVPEAISGFPGGRVRSNSTSSRSRRHRSPSSSESSLATTVDTTPSCTPVPTPMRNNDENGTTTSGLRCDRRNNEIPEAESPLGHWPHSLSSMLACLSCSLGLFNICRFAMLSIHFGANFIFQFMIISLVVGLPMFTLQLCLGQQLGAGVIDMWRISPLFQGVGVSLLVSQALIGLYSITGVSWMFVYFRDSFITKMDKYRWAEPFYHYRREQPYNTSFKLSDTIPDYLSGVVYQRTNLVYGNVYGTIKFQPAFNLAVVWMIVFVSLSKGLRSYGKVIYVFTLLPVFATFILCAKLLGMMPPEYIHVIFPETSWSEFFLNSKSWIAAGQEALLTWGLLSAAVMQLASHNKNKHLLQRDSSLIAVLTFSILLLVAFLANTCVQILHSYGYTYQPNSFEKLGTYTFLRQIKDPLPPSLASTPVRYMVHNSYILGEKVVRPGMDTTVESGYQVLRLATELVPATFALLGSEKISPFWAVLFYFILILFGIAQQLAIWHCVITGIMAIKAKVLKSWETTITFFSCACGFILGLPMTTELGIYVVYFLDVTVGGLWWLILVLLLQIIAVFMVRGRPYSGDTVVTALFKSSTPSCLSSWAPALLSFVWNVILPVVLMVFCVAFFKNGNFRELFVWHHAPSIEYWPLWARQIGSMIQLLPVLCVPIVAVIQSYRYLSSGPPDILDRIQYLYRPPLGEHMEELAVHDASATVLASSVPEVRTEDPPPKYTPPPSYTTATGARIAKLLRQSIRRSVRRLANVLGEGSSRQQHQPPIINNNNNTAAPPPPDYNTVLVEMNQTPSSSDVSIYMTESSGIQTSQTDSANLTAADVASILRNSFRRSTARAANTIRRNITGESGNASLSAENLVDAAAPIGETSLVLDHLDPDEHDNDKTVNSNQSVI